MIRFVKGILNGILFICSIGFLWFMVIQPFLTQKEAELLKDQYSFSVWQNESVESSQDTKGISQLDFASLRSRYPDVQGWLTIPGTCVDYPVLQSDDTDPEHYLRRNYDGKWRMAGSLFFQYDCTPQSRNKVIFGHNMNDGTMFGVLEKLADQEFCERHSTVLLETEDGVQEYRIVSVLTTDLSGIPFNRTRFADDQDYLTFAGTMLAGTGYEPQTEKRLLTLVTCAYEWEGARTVVVAVEI